MNTEKSLERKIGQLLWSGKVSEAKRVLDAEVKDIKAQIDEAQAKLNELRKKEAKINQLQADRNGDGLIVPQSDKAKMQRNKAVVDLAKSIAINGMVRTDELAIKLESENIDLAVADNRKATVISNILFRTGKFKRKERGLYIVPDED